MVFPDGDLLEPAFNQGFVEFSKVSALLLDVVLQVINSFNLRVSGSGVNGAFFTLTETIFKIENWGRFDAGEDGDPFKLEYDVCVISTADASIDFKWLDDTHTAFSITLHDKENSYWTEECLVTFVVSSTE